MKIPEFLRVSREESPCLNCQERFTACSDRCPKDLRGERGYKAFTDNNKKVQKAREEYLKKKYMRYR